MIIKTELKQLRKDMNEAKKALDMSLRAYAKLLKIPLATLARFLDGIPMAESTIIEIEKSFRSTIKKSSN